MSSPRSGAGTVDAILARLLALHPKRIDLSLDRVERLLAALDHPEQKLPPLIHVAGTNGKGSTIAFMRAILEAAGKRVHVYTSPNLVHLNERFRIGREGGGKLVDDAALADALAECEAKNGDAPITVFEIETAAAFLLFSRHPADILLLEVGLGGRLDATNVVERPLASVITPVSVDHRDFLGDTIEQIAAEKAGILKRGVPAVIASQVREALAVIERQAGRMKAPLSIAGENWTATEERGRLVYQDNDGLLDLPAPKLYGRHQFENAGTAIAALRTAGLKLPVAAFEAGMTRVEWPARMQRLAHGRLHALLPPESELWLDGGHNADGGRAVAGALADLEETGVATAGAGGRHAVDQGLRGLLAQFLRLGAPRHHRAGPSGQGGAGRGARRHRADHRHSGDRARHCGECAHGRRQARSASGAARSHHRLALSRRRSLGRQRHAAGMTRTTAAATPCRPRWRACRRR